MLISRRQCHSVCVLKGCGTLCEGLCFYIAGEESRRNSKLLTMEGKKTWAGVPMSVGGVRVPIRTAFGLGTTAVSWNMDLTPSA